MAHTPFQQGRAARVTGQRLDANPHPENSQSFNDWHDGWTSKPNPAYGVFDNLERYIMATGMTYDEAKQSAERLTASVKKLDAWHTTPDGSDRFTVERDFS